MRNTNKSGFRWKRSGILLAAVIVLLAGAVGGTWAFLVAQSEPVQNNFTYAHVRCTINEKFENGVKSDVAIQNTGDIPAYIRARIVVTWKDENGNVSSTVPVKDSDYTMTMGTGWTKGTDDYWYCKTAVNPDDFTPELITECKKTDNANVPDGYDLSVEILADAIQSEPANAVKEAWGENNPLSKSGN